MSRAPEEPVGLVGGEEREVGRSVSGVVGAARTQVVSMAMSVYRAVRIVRKRLNESSIVGFSVS